MFLGTEYQTFEDLKRLLFTRVACVVGLICLKIFDAKNPKSKKFAVNLGYALQLTNIIRDVGEDYKMGRIYIPGEDLENYGIKKEDLRISANSPAFLAPHEISSESSRTFF